MACERPVILNPGSSSLKIAHPTLGEETIRFPTMRLLERLIRERKEKIGREVIIRTVHAGAYRGILRATTRVKQAVEESVAYAPLHNPPVILLTRLLEAARVRVYYALDTTPYPREPLVTLPLPKSVRRKIPGGGFHGWSHLHASWHAQAKGWREYITIHTGSGNSITAWRKEKPVWTSMLITPLHGVMGATRSGMLDPGLVLLLVKWYGLGKAEDILWRESGWYALSREKDFRRIYTSRDPRAREAVNAYSMSLAEQVSIARVHLSRVDGIVFTGPISSHKPLRERVMRKAKLNAPVIYTPSREEEAIWKAWEEECAKRKT